MLAVGFQVDALAAAVGQAHLARNTASSQHAYLTGRTCPGASAAVLSVGLQINAVAAAVSPVCLAGRRTRPERADFTWSTLPFTVAAVVAVRVEVRAYSPADIKTLPPDDGRKCFVRDIRRSDRRCYRACRTCVDRYGITRSCGAILSGVERIQRCNRTSKHQA